MINAQTKYYTLIPSENCPYTEDANGHIAGMEWQDSSGNTFRAILRGFDAKDYIYGHCNYKYEIFVKPDGTNEYFPPKEKYIVVDSRMIDTTTGEFVSEVDFPEGFPESCKPEFTHFINTVGKQILFPPMLSGIAKENGLTLTN